MRLRRLRLVQEEVISVARDSVRVPPLWAEIPGQSELVDYFRQAVAGGEVGHAYLFIGPDGVGKEAVARALAAALNCREQGCGVCSHCQRIRRGVHPDVFAIEPEGNFLLLAQIRELRQRVYLRPLEGRRKVYLIREAESLTPVTANALLKMLEEPPLDVVFILMAQNEDSLLATVRSRCQEVRFHMVSQGSLREHLKSHCQLSDEQAALISRVSGGIPGRALAIAQSEEAQERRRLVLELLDSLSAIDVFEVFQMAERLMTEIRRPIDNLKQEQEAELAAALERASQGQASALKKRLQAAHKRAVNRQELEGVADVLRTLTSWYRDLLVLKESGRTEILINLDFRQRLQREAESWSREAILRALTLVKNTKDSLKVNVNRELAMEVMLLELQEVV